MGESLLKSTDLNPKLRRWELFLQQFMMAITYRPGTKMLMDCQASLANS